jgi:uncharacterized protein YigE (DUF2233 family)
MVVSPVLGQVHATCRESAGILNSGRGMTRKLSLLAAVVLFAAAARAADWTAVSPGVDYREFVAEGIDVHVTRVDLASDAVRVIVSRESERGLRVSDFARKNKAVAAINGDYFDDKFNPIGLTIGPCGVWTGSKDTKREGVVAIGSKSAEIRTQSEVMDPPEPWVSEAISGWPMLVSHCEVVAPLPGSPAFTTSPHPRSAIGLSEDGKKLYLVVADGRRANVPGMTLPQLAAFLHDKLGVCSAINLDGGGSSAMWVGDRIVNRPSDGVERRVGDHIAVVAAVDYAAGCAETLPQPAMVSSSTTTSSTPATTTTTSTASTTTTTTTTTSAPPPATTTAPPPR